MVIVQIATKIHKESDNTFNGTYKEVVRGVHHMIYNIWWTVIVNNPRTCIGEKDDVIKNKVMRRSIEILRVEIRKVIMKNGKGKLADFFMKYRVPRQIPISNKSAFKKYHRV